MGQRAFGKKLIAAYASDELWGAIDDWLLKHPGQSVSNFIVAACVDKLKQENIPVDEANVFRDGRVRIPSETAQPQPKPVNYRKKPSSRTVSARAALLKSAVASVQHHEAK